MRAPVEAGISHTGADFQAPNRYRRRNVPQAVPMHASPRRTISRRHLLGTGLAAGIVALEAKTGVIKNTTDVAKAGFIVLLDHIDSARAEMRNELRPATLVRQYVDYNQRERQYVLSDIPKVVPVAFTPTINDQTHQVEPIEVFTDVKVTADKVIGIPEAHYGIRVLGNTFKGDFGTNSFKDKTNRTGTYGLWFQLADANGSPINPYGQPSTENFYVKGNVVTVIDPEPFIYPNTDPLIPTLLNEPSEVK